MDYPLAPTPTDDTLYSALGPINSITEFFLFIAQIEEDPRLRITPNDQQLSNDYQALLSQQSNLNKLMEDWGLWEGDLIQYSKEAEQEAIHWGILKLMEERRVQEEKWWEKLMEKVLAEMAAEEEREAREARNGGEDS